MGTLLAFHQQYQPVLGSILLSALVAGLPLYVLFVMLAILRLPAWLCALAAMLTAALLSWAVWGMPFGITFATATEGMAFGLWPISWRRFRGSGGDHRFDPGQPRLRAGHRRRPGPACQHRPCGVRLDRNPDRHPGRPDRADPAQRRDGDYSCAVGDGRPAATAFLDPHPGLPDRRAGRLEADARDPAGRPRHRHLFRHSSVPRLELRRSGAHRHPGRPRLDGLPRGASPLLAAGAGMAVCARDSSSRATPFSVRRIGVARYCRGLELFALRQNRFARTDPGRVLDVRGAGGRHPGRPDGQPALFLGPPCQ